MKCLFISVEEGCWCKTEICTLVYFIITNSIVGRKDTFNEGSLWSAFIASEWTGQKPTPKSSNMLLNYPTQQIKSAKKS